MPKKKQAKDLTTEGAMKRLSPKKLRDELRCVAHERDHKELKGKDLSRWYIYTAIIYFTQGLAFGKLNLVL